MDTTGDLCTVLGVKKGSLRVRPHPVTWKPHVLLRRVELDTSDLLDADGQPSKPMVYFSLFAAKKIDVKPGKEILVAFAAPYGEDDKAVMIGGLLPNEDDAEDPEDSQKTQTVVKETSIIPPDTPPANMFPPKMRKTWLRRPYDDATLEGE